MSGPPPAAAAAAPATSSSFAKLEDDSIVQIRVQGQRYQSTAAILGEHCTLFSSSGSGSDSGDDLFNPDLATSCEDGEGKKEEGSISWRTSRNDPKFRFTVRHCKEQTMEQKRWEPSWFVCFETGNETTKKEEGEPEPEKEKEQNRNAGGEEESTPRKILSSEFVGPILVYIRKVTMAARKQKHQEGGAAVPEVRSVAKTMRWEEELEYGQQVAFSDVVRVFGVRILVDGGYSQPSKPKPPPTQQQQQQQAEASGDKPAADDGDAEKKKHADDDDDDDHRLIMQTLACVLCGVTGHDTSTCKYNCCNPGAPTPAEAPNSSGGGDKTGKEEQQQQEGGSEEKKDGGSLSQPDD